MERRLLSVMDLFLRVFIILLFLFFQLKETFVLYKYHWTNLNPLIVDYFDQVPLIEERTTWFKIQSTDEKFRETRFHRCELNKNGKDRKKQIYKGCKRWYGVYPTPSQLTLNCYPVSGRTEETRNNEVQEAFNGLEENLANLQLDTQEIWGRIAEFRSMFPLFSTEDLENQNQNGIRLSSQNETSGATSQADSSQSSTGSTDRREPDNGLGRQPTRERNVTASFSNIVTSVTPERIQEPTSNNRHTTRNVNVPTDDCAHPEYYRFLSRRLTFNNWRSRGQSPDEMAEAGFFCIGNDCVRCFACGLGLRCWEETDNPWIEHIKFSKNCPHVLRCKGQDYCDIVSEVARMSNNLQEETPFRPGQGAISLNEQRRQLQQEIRNPLQHPAAQEALGCGFLPPMVKEAIEILVRDHGWGCLCTGLLLAILCQMIQSNITVEARQQKDEATSTRRSEDQNVEEERRHHRERYMCKVCLHEEVQMVFLPCRHTCCCVQCAFALTKCPMCRSNIKDKVRVWLDQ